MARRFKSHVSRILHRFGTSTCTRAQVDERVTVHVPEPKAVLVSTPEDVEETPSAPDTIIIPDLVSHCDFSIHCNPKVETAVEESKSWLFEHGQLGEKRKNAFRGLRAGELTSMCYPYAEFDRLRVCCDFMNYLFHLDDLSDDMTHLGTRRIADDVMNTLYCPNSYESNSRVSTLTRDFWKRLIKDGSPGAQQRFMSTMDTFFQAITIQAKDRRDGVIPDLDSYISVRRDTSGCKPCWALTEYANGLDIPDEVIEHPVVEALGEAANDLVTWSNDVFSYNREQAKGDTHNMIVILMKHRGLDLQSSVDYVGDMCKQSIDRFIAERDRLPSWGPEIDEQVKIYVDGLADWIVGSLHWSFDSERYFGKLGLQVKATRRVTLYPRAA